MVNTRRVLRTGSWKASVFTFLCIASICIAASGGSPGADEHGNYTSRQAFTAPAREIPSSERQKHMSPEYGRLRLSFEVNEGQTDAQVKFLFRGKGYALYLTHTAAVLTLSKLTDEESTVRPSSPFASPPTIPG